MHEVRTIAIDDPEGVRNRKSVCSASALYGFLRDGLAKIRIKLYTLKTNLKCKSRWYWQ